MAKKSKKTKTKAVKEDETAEISEKNLSISSTTASPEKETKDDKWKLKKIYDISQLQDSSPTMCDGNDCTLVACSQWKSSQNGDIWNACLDCQLERFQGWPDTKDEYPVEFIDEDHRKIMIQLCSGEKYAITPRIPFRKDGTVAELEAWETERTTQKDSILDENTDKSDELTDEKNSDDTEEPSDDKIQIEPTKDEESDEQWDIKHIFTMKEIEHEGKKCDTKNCPLKACSIWISSEKEEWNGCLDCQEEYYERWPEKTEDYPITFMSIEHREMIWDQCTGKYKPDMPQLPLTDGGSMEELHHWEKEHGIGKFRAVEGDTELSTFVGVKADVFGSEDMNKAKMSVTPLPQSDTVDMSRGNSMVTPSPHPPHSKKANAKEKLEKNKQHLQLHEKWQKEADRLGGGKIIVNKDAAKSTIFDFLRDAFRPMNITEIYNGLKASVPNQMVKMCLDDMALDHFVKESQFFDSDDENDDPKPSTKSGKSSPGNIIPSDVYAGSLCLKKGRNVNTTLYYVDYTKQFNNGNGLLPEDRNELFSKHAGADAEKSSTENKIKYLSSEANVLLSQPTNIDLTSILESLDAEVVDLRSQMEVAYSFKDNEKIRMQIRKKIDVMQAQWRKRKRLCMDFLREMEEITEGSISMKKSLSGDGPIELESDESAIKGSILFNQKKRQREKSFQRLDLDGASKKQRVDIPTDSFIGVELTSSGIKRVYLDEK